MNQDQFDDQVEAAFAHHDDRALRAQLAAQAATDPSLAARWGELEPAFDALSSAGLEPLPEGLHETLLRTAGEARRARPVGGWLSFITAAMQVRPAYALGGAVAAGIVIGAFGFALIVGNAQDRLRSANDAAPQISASLPPLPTAAAVTTLELGSTRVELTARRSEHGIVTRVDARGDEGATLTLVWDASALRLSGVRWETSLAPAFESAAGRVELPIPLAAGSELSWSEIAPEPGAVRVTLSSAGHNVVKEETLRLPR